MPFPKLRWLLTAVLMLVLAVNALALVPPVPKYANPPRNWENTRIEGNCYAEKGVAPQELPNNIIVFRVQFSDATFRSTPAYPDSLVHNEEFFNRWMFHLQDYFNDASHGAYKLNYTMFPRVVNLPNTMAYYGADSSEKIDARLPEMLPHLLAQVDAEVDFRNFGGVIIFHAGSGQESDIDEARTNQVWSTFLTRRNLQAAFDPQNDHYPGYTTADGAVLKNVVVVPEDEFQDYFPSPEQENASAYLFSIYGVLAHQFGHVLGLPTLFDNDSSNGKSQGIGNWGLMGTGVWNANGYVPAQLCAYSRYLLGWETPVVISNDSSINLIDQFLNHSPEAIRLYKIPISATEYFLLENRQQNPDGSLDPYSNQPSYSFKLLPEGEQDYYDNYPLLPYFNFMENRYAGCEWDFFLPGLGGPSTGPVLQDGSGLLIWHIDEDVINASFTANFDRNYVNGDAYHKGVDLEEADGVQQLDTSIYDIYKWGGPNDSFRQGNNSYFGDQYLDGLLSLPTSASYYGGIPLEVYNISASGNQMSFAVRFRWRLNTDFQGKNTISAAALDFDQDGQDELFYPMPDGSIYLWDDDELVSGFPLARMPIKQTWVWDDNALYLPMELQGLSRLYKLANDNRRYVFTANNSAWASHPIDLGDKLVLPLNWLIPGSQEALGTSSLYVYDKASASATENLNLASPIVSNLVKFRDQILMVQKDDQLGYLLTQTGLDVIGSASSALPVPADSTIVGIFMAPIIPGQTDGNLVVQCPNSVYVFDSDLHLASGFPFIYDLVAETDTSTVAPLTLADVDGNGSLDIIIGGERGMVVVDYQGSRMNSNSSYNVQDAEGVSAGVLAADIDGDGKAELLGNFANNRLGIYEHDFRSKAGYPVSYSERSRSLPFLSKASDSKWYIYVAGDNGQLNREQSPAAPLANPALNWQHEYAGFNRWASIDPVNLPNQYQNSARFVPDQVYIYPNPLKRMFDQRIYLNIMPTRDTKVELQVYDISGTRVYEHTAIARAYLKNLDIFEIPADKLSSGVYIAIIKADGYNQRIKFAVEK